MRSTPDHVTPDHVTPDPGGPEPWSVDDAPNGGGHATTSRRSALHLAAAAAAGVVGASALSERAAAADGDPVRLGEWNSETSPTRIYSQEAFPDINGPGPIALELESPGGHLRFIGAPGDTAFGTYPVGTLVYNGTTGLDIWQPGIGGVERTTLARPGMAGAFALLSTPQRIFDSRPDLEPDLAEDGIFAAGETRTINILAAGSELLDEGLTGVMINLTATGTTGPGFLTVYSAALDTPPATSNVNWTAAGATVANMAVTAIEGSELKVTCGGAGSTHVIIDVMGTYG
jgi:hypothetical protein